MKKKNIILGFGTITAVAAPILAVVACSDDYSYSDADVALLAKLSKKSVRDKLELTWISQVLKHKDINKIGTSEFATSFIKSAKYFIAQHIRLNPKYLSTIRHIIAINDTTIVEGKPNTGSDAWQAVNGNGTPGTSLNWEKGIYEVKEIDKAIKGLTDDKIGKIFFDKQIDSKTKKLIFNPVILKLKLDILKIMVAKKYLSITKKEYLDVFKDKDKANLKSIKNLTKISTKNYPLILATIKAKLGHSWKIALNKAQSAQYMDPTIGYKTTEVEKKYLAGDNYALIKKQLKYTDGLKTIPKSIFTHTEVQDLKGYEGIKNIFGASDNLGTSETDMKASKKTVIGILSEGKVIPLEDAKTEVTFIDKASGELKINKVLMFLPHYSETKKELTFDEPASTASPSSPVPPMGDTTGATSSSGTTIGGTTSGGTTSGGTTATPSAAASTITITAAQAMDAILSKDANMYQDAMKYFTKKSVNPIILTITNEKVRDALLKNPNMDFIKK